MRMERLPWDWEEKVKDFVKPQDPVLNLRAQESQKPLSFPDGSFQVVLSRGPLCDFPEVRRVLRPGGFFLMEPEGSEDSRSLTDFLLPERRPLPPVNLENQTPLLRQAGFRVMYRDQAYPLVRFHAMDELLRYIALSPWRFPGFSEEACAPRLQRLEERLKAQGFLETRGHRFLLIGKKRN